MCASSSCEHTTEHTPNDERTSPGTADELRAEFAFPDPTRPDHTRTTPNSPSIPTSSTSTREPRLDVDGVDPQMSERAALAIAGLFLVDAELRGLAGGPFDVSAPAVPVVPSGGE